MRFRFAVNKLHGDPHAVCRFAHASFNNIIHAKFAGDFLRLDRFSLMHEYCVPRYNKKVAKARQLGDDVLRQSIGEELLLGIAAHIDEGKNRDRWLSRADRGGCVRWGSAVSWS